MLSLVLLALSLIDRMGYPLLKRQTCLMGVCLALVSLLVWAGLALFKKFKSRIAKFVGGMVMSFIVMFVAILLFSYVGEFTALTMPQPYAKIRHSETGKTAAVMRVLDMNLESEELLNESVDRLAARYNAMVEAGAIEPVDIENDGYPIEAYGYAVTAFPQKLAFFYHANADVEGTVYIGYSSEATLAYEWLEEDVLRIYLKDPEPGDTGEIIVHF